MVRQQDRRRFLQMSGLVAAIGIAGCSGSPDGDSTQTATGTPQTESTAEPTEESTEAGMDPVSFDFDESRDSLSTAGWQIGESVDLSDSHLRGTDRENNQRDYAMFPSAETGTWSLGGVVNDEQFYGVQFILSTADAESTDVDGDTLDTAEGYSLLVRQERFGGLRFRKLTADGDGTTSTSLHEEAFESSGEPNDYEIAMLESNQFRISMNGTELATVTDDTFDVNSLVVRFDAADQRVDSVAYSP